MSYDLAGRQISVTDAKGNTSYTNITDAILLNNSQGASTFGHNAVLLVNPSGQGLFFSFYKLAKNTGEMRFSVLSKNQVAELKDYSGEVKNTVTVYGNVRSEIGNQAYDRFVWRDVANFSNGQAMYMYAAGIFVDPGSYSLTGRQCDYIASQILSAGGLGYTTTGKTPNVSYGLYTDKGIHWINQNGRERGVEACGIQVSF